MKTYFLLLLLIGCSHCAISPFVGGFTSINSTNSDLSNVLTFITTHLPELANWTVANAKQQVVNGFNYQISFTNQGQTAEVTVYSTFSGRMTLTSYTLNSIKQNVTGYSSIKSATPTAANISAASHNTSEASNKTANSTVNDVYIVSNPLITDISLVGGFQELPLNTSSIYNDAWTQVLRTYQNLQNYTLLEVRSQVVAGMKFIFVAESPAEDEVIVIQVFQSLSHNYTVSILQTNTAVGFTAKEIIAFQKKCIELKPELKDYQLVYISNVEGQKGLKLMFTLESEYVIADCGYENGERKVVFEQ